MLPPQLFQCHLTRIFFSYFCLATHTNWLTSSWGKSVPGCKLPINCRSPNASAYQENFIFMEQFEDGPFLFQRDRKVVHQSKVHIDMDDRIWCGTTWLACTESKPHPVRTPFRWIRAGSMSQAFCPTSVSDLKHVLVEEWSEIFRNTPCGKPSQTSPSC